MTRIGSIILNLFLWVFALLAVPGMVRGQNNPYGIDDDCYRYFSSALSLTGKDGFKEKNDSLLIVAEEKHDDKARVLHYALKLRSVSREPDVEAERVHSAQDELKEIAEATGYMQYYFQSYETLKNYYFNKGMNIRSLEILQDMGADAIERDNQYGMWLSDINMADYYASYGVCRIARRYLSKVINVYNNTDDATIKRQSISPFYRKYAETFPYDVDSVPKYLNLAMSNALIADDSIRCEREFAKLYAAQGNYELYVKYRDKCLSSGNRSAVGRFTPLLFEYIDSLYAGRWHYDNRTLHRSLPLEDIRLLAIVSDRLGTHEISDSLNIIYMDSQESEMADFLEMNLAEMEARYDNYRLRSDLADTSARAEKTTRLSMALAIILLLIVIIAMLVYMRILRRGKENDKRMIEELRIANEQVRQANEIKTRFLQNMTHELRTPLNAISGFSQLLAAMGDTLSAEERDEFSGYIVNNTRMMTMLLDDIINSQVMDKGEYKVTIEDSDCESICRNAIMAAEHRLQPGVQIHFVPSMQLPFRFKTDPMRTEQVLTNLLTNACKHTKAGEIRLGCSLDEIPGMIAFSVEDTGPGIPESEAEHIFERFVKLDSFVQGTGLGLSISREIASKLGGNVFLDTSYGPGARFVFTVPV